MPEAIKKRPEKAVHKCTKLEKKLMAAAKRAQILQKKIEEKCKKSIKDLPAPVSKKMAKLAKTLTDVKKRAKVIKAILKPKTTPKAAQKKLKKLDLKSRH